MNWVQSIKNYLAWNEQEEKDKAIILKCIDMFDDILTRDNDIVHITSSAFVVNKNRDKALMVHHNIYNSWSWTGGHADGDDDLLYVAIKEVKEETGIQNIRPVIEDMISLDILPVLGHKKRGNYIAPHLHLSVAYLLEGDEDEPLFVKPDENSSVQWVPFEEIDAYSDEPHMKGIYNKVISKIQG
ncbi:ADP-ribose pyrophosphatase YjhB (NUDIX family) [Scopulibacillus darangshiensis]|uniref:ADP-ribose pyrophosphatase YjhB (NUDIX family) n=1 Tax=Scopulibacillus darangshiensis TaxID=442528 RepID=A0A4R2P7Q6_9BACL|nr:NUDIX hydrolase [Scopulibacillus darangshiensis]TCP30933.1 ADP-ribose pyrophosphatase YjhB (NUDIX family) [Scopulibacillus darangshiensis]